MRVPDPLTPREREVLRILAACVSDERFRRAPMREASRRLHITEAGVKMALYRLRRKYFKATQFAQEYRVWRRKLGGRYL
jgi:DNA-binding CsgD family transcriptional regulator